MFYVLKCCFPRFEEHLAYNNSQSAYSEVWAQAEWLGRRYQFVQYTGEHLLVSFCVQRKLFILSISFQITIWGNNFETRMEMLLSVCVFLLHYLNSVAHTLSPAQVWPDGRAGYSTGSLVLGILLKSHYIHHGLCAIMNSTAHSSFHLTMWKCTSYYIIGSPWHQFNFFSLFPGTA